MHKMLPLLLHVCLQMVVGPALARPRLSGSFVRSAVVNSRETDGGARIGVLHQKLDALLHHPLLRKLRVGITVHDARTGNEVFAQNADSMFNPASNTKIFTTAAALSVLGPNFRFRTALWASRTADDRASPDVMRGPVFLQGSGDPSLQPFDLVNLVHDLSRRGIRRIEGDIFLDGEFRAEQDLEKPAPAPGFGSGALALNRGTVRVRVFPTQVGSSARSFLEPPSSYFVLRSSVKTVAGKKAKILVETHRKDGHLIVEVRGRIGRKRDKVIIKRHVPDGQSWIAATLSAALQDLGIAHVGEFRVGPPPPGPLRIQAEHLSAPLSEICRVVNKDSNNFVADVVWKTLGSARFGLPQSLEKGARAVAEWMAPLGFEPGRLRLVNGSGLTYENRVRPVDVSKMLLWLYHSLDLGPEFMQTLAIGGIDGTIHHRFRGASQGLVRGKTGTLNGVSVLSGYVGSHPGVLVFTIFVEGFRAKRLARVRQFQAQVVEVLLRHVRAGIQEASPAPWSVPLSPNEPKEEGDRHEEDVGVGDEEAL